jgi:Phosphotransferase enzyme family
VESPDQALLKLLRNPNMDPTAFLADPGLPQLAIASDPVMMREVFQTHLRLLTHQAYRIQDCLVSRIRYRRGSRCVLQYTLHLVEPATGLERSQWVTGVIDAEGRAERAWQRLRAADPTQEVPEAYLTFEPVCFISTLKMLVQVFPYDRRLQGLCRLMTRPSPDLEPLLLSGFGPGSWRAQRWDLEPIRYRAQLGAVLRYTVHARETATGRTAMKCFYAKIFRDEEGERAYQVLQALWERAEAGGEGFTVGRPMAYLGDLHALVQEEAPGTSLQQILLQGCDMAAAVRKVARTLAVFHQEDLATTRRHARADEIADLERAGTLLQWACPLLKGEVDAVVSAVAKDLEDVPPRPTHRDLKPDHILLDGDRLALLDLDWYTGADSVLDAAALLATVVSTPFRFHIPHDRVRTAVQALAEEYFVHVPRAWRRRLHLHYAGAALKEAVGFFRRQEPRWPETIAAMVEEAENSLAGRIW